ncbi:MAG: hypothetical protein V3V01_03355 [Acidimicrobiales bacterium]
MAASRTDQSRPTHRSSDRFVTRRRLRRVVRQFRQLPEGELPGAELLEDLQSAWKNGAHDQTAIDTQFLGALLDWAVGEERSVLEIGSGVSTILLGLLAERSGAQIVTIEHSHRAHSIICRQLASLRIRSVEVRYGDLSSEATQCELPNSIGLVSVNAPPEHRGNVLESLRDQLAGDSVILCADADLGDERDRIQQWLYDFPTEIISDHGSYLVLGFARNRIVRMLPS